MQEDILEIAAELQTLSTEKLAALVLDGGETNFMPKTIAEVSARKLARVRKVVQDAANLYRTAICGHPTIQGYLDDKRTPHRIKAVAAIVALFQGEFVGVAAIAAAELLLREGLTSLCEGC